MARARGTYLTSAIKRLLLGGLFLGGTGLLISCQLDDLLKPASPPKLLVSPALLSDSAALGSLAPRTLSLAVTSDGGPGRAWQASTAGKSPWLVFLPTSGTAPATLAAELRPRDLSEGAHQDTIVFVTQDGADAINVPVRFAIRPCRTTSIAPDTTVTDSLSLADCAAPHRGGRLARVYTFTADANDSLSVLLASPAFDPYVVLDSSAAAPAIAENDNCPGAGPQACLRYVHLARAGSYLLEVTSADPNQVGAFRLEIGRPHAPIAPSSLAQSRSDSTTSLMTGAVMGDSTVVLRAWVSDPDWADLVRMEVEVKPVGAAFTGTGTVWGTLVAAGTTGYVRVGGLPDLTSYHWQSRAVDQTGRASAWVSFGGNPEDAADFSVRLREAPKPPTDLGQFKVDGATAIPSGGATDERTIILRASVRAANGIDPLRLEVEVKPVDAPFVHAATAASPEVASGGTASAAVSGLDDNVAYHWQARAVDRNGNQSEWVARGGEPDFRVALPATRLAFVDQPSDATAGIPIAPAVRVAAQDGLGNTLTSFSGDVTVAIGTNPGDGRLAGTTTVAAVHGVAAFDDLGIDKVGAGYTLVAAASGLSGATSTAFTVTPAAAAALVFTTQPSPATAGAAITPPVQVTLQDPFGNTAAGFIGDVTVVIGTNAGHGTLSGTTTVPAVDGVARFTDLGLDRSGADYTLIATAAGLPNTTSAPFTITPGGASAAQSTVAAGPASITASTGTSSALITVTARDANGNPVPGATVALTASGSGNRLSPESGPTDANGVMTAAFSATTAETKTLSAAVGGLAITQTATVTVTPAGAATLVVTVQPSTAPAGTIISPAVQIAARDSYGNGATDYRGDVTVALGANSSGGTLSGTRTVAAANGVATFADLSIDRAGTGFTLAATAAGLSGATSAPFDVVVGPTSKLVFTVQPGTTAAGAAITPAVEITAQDALGNTVTGFNGNVTVAIGTNPAGGTLSGTTVIAAVGGVATFENLRLDKVGSGYTLVATTAGLSGATSAGFDVTPGPATRLTFSIQPSASVAGANLAPPVQVTAQDAYGNTASGFAGNVTVALGANPGAGTLSGTRIVAAAGGVAAFSTLSIDQAGTGYTLTATASGLTAVTSTAFDIAAANAAQLVFTVQPTNVAAGAAITPAVQVTAQDAYGNRATSYAGDVTAAMGANPGGGALSGATRVTAVSGVATFSTLSIDKSGTGYTLSATATGLTGATSAAFNVTVTADRLVFSVQPTNALAGATISPAVRVTAQDGLGNTATGFTGNVTVAIGTNPAAGTLSGTKTAAAVAGVASFSNLSVDQAGTGYTLEATSGTLTPATSLAFDITAGGVSASQSTVTASPTTITAGAGASPATITVTARDANSNPIAGATVVLSVSGSSNTLSPASGTTSATGVLTATLSSTKAETKTVSATINGVAVSQQATVTVTAAGATQLAFTVQPSNTAANATITPAVQVTAQDGFSNRAISFAGTVTAALGANPAGGTLSGTRTVTAVSGVATFSSLSIDKAGTGYTLTAAATDLAGDTSAAFNVTAAAATKLVFTVQPTDTVAGADIRPAVQVTAQDASGNTATSFTASVTIALWTNPGGGTLSGAKTVPAVNGVATFSDLSIDKVGTGYTVQATSGTLAPATSVPFNITAGPVSPSRSTVNASLATITASSGTSTATITVTARDGFGNVVSNATVLLAATGSGNTLSPASGTTNASGVMTATFSSTTAETKTISATLDGVAVTPSATVTVTAASATQLAFTVQPSNATAGAPLTPAVQVTARDAFGNAATTFTGSVTVAIGTNPSGGTLSGTAAAAAVSGVATFGDLSIDRSGTGYTLTAAATGLTSATSTAFALAPGAASVLVFTVQPTNSVAGAAIAPAVQVTARDALGNTATGFAGSVTMSLGTNPPGGTLSGTTTATAASGVATFSDLRIEKAGTGYSLAAATTGLAGATSAPFNITPAAATQLVFTVQPTNTQANQPITPAVQVTARDAFANVASGFTGTVTIRIGNDGSVLKNATLSGTLDVPAASGVGTFSDLRIDQIGLGYTLAVSATGLTGATSGPFDIVP